MRQIIDRARQGVTRPFICIADDGHTYYVKGKDAGWGSLVSEWVAGTLAHILGLPIPDFRLVEVEEEILQYSSEEYKNSLGAGIWFGSRGISAVEELSWEQRCNIPISLQANILLFDWWVANGDRSLSERGGNPNLLWEPACQKLHMIDHNLAFDDAGLSQYMTVHVFHDARRSWDRNFRKEQSDRLQLAAAQLDEIWSEMPAEWTNADCDVTLDKVRNILTRVSTNSENFWSFT